MSSSAASIATTSSASNAQPMSAAEGLMAAITPSRASIIPSSGKGKKAASKEQAPRELPPFVSPEPKNASERRDWDRMSTRMEGFHSYFRETFQKIWMMSDKVEPHMLQDYFEFIGEYEHHLHFHHQIEEVHIFPILAKKMPEFQMKSGEHLEEHQHIHDGMDRMKSYIAKCKAKPTEYSATEFQKLLASWGPVLFYHLNAEVKTLHRDNLRRYWTIEEVRRLPM